MNKLFGILVVVLAFSLLPTAYANDGWNSCAVNTPCIIGEYVFNGNYSPLTSQICNITINTPSGTTAINQAWMQNNSNGWHNYTYTPTAIGYYPAFMNCLNGSDTGRMDKSFITTNTSTNLNITVNATVTGGGLTAEEHSWLSDIRKFILILYNLVSNL